jgi:hypothetical protein
MVSIAEAERIRSERVSESRLGRQRRGSVAARPLPQRRLPKAAAGRIELWSMISYVISQSISYMIS